MLFPPRIYFVGIVSIFATSLPRFADAFSSPSVNTVVAKSTSNGGGAPVAVDGDSSDINRVFVAGIPSSSTEESIRSAFAQFGPVNDVIVIGTDHYTNRKNRSPYAFVTFDDGQSAQRAIEAPVPTTTNNDNNDDDDALLLYKEVRPAAPIDTRRRSNESRSKEIDKVEKIEAMGKETNLIIQVQSTHLDRLEGYLNRRYSYGENSNDGSMHCKVLGSTRSPNSKNVSLLFLSCASSTNNNPIELARELHKDPLLARAINKSYVVQPGSVIKGNLSIEEGCNVFAETLYDQIISSSQCSVVDEEGEDATTGEDTNSPVSLRMQIFPPRHQSGLLRPFGALIDDNEQRSDGKRKKVSVAPKAFNHILSVVEVYQYKGRGWEQKQYDIDNRLYMSGICEGSFKLDVVDTNNNISENSNGDDVSRAYYKLKEAVETYESTRGTKLNGDLYNGSIALDCGSAPGGWTKYLIEHFQCQTVYSIDPGELSPTVLKMKETRHLQMKIQDAMPLLLLDNDSSDASTGNNDESGKVKIWVSDMCLHNMEEQVDQLLHAKTLGLLASNAFFVLTLKCVVGHSKSSYDAQVKYVVDKLCESEDVTGVEIFHLFSNRSGERTVIGYIK